MQKAFFQINNLEKVYNRGTPSEVRALRGLSLSMHKGEFVTIVGSNAAGKTTLFNSIAGSLVLDRGSVEIDGKQITEIPEHIRAQTISRVRQNPNDGAVGAMTIAENFALAKLRAVQRGLGRGVTPALEAEAGVLLAPLGLGLERRLHDPMDLLSGGQKQTVALLMATMTEPKLLLLDEHTAALDPRMSERVLAITNELVRKKGITTLMITHNITHAIQYGDRMILLDRGRVAFEARGDSKKNLTIGSIVQKIEDCSLELEEDFSKSGF